jgi:hypothetical protein
MPEDSGAELARIEIVRWLRDDEEDIVTSTYSDGLTLLDALGMLAFATATCLPDFEATDD